MSSGIHHKFGIGSLVIQYISKQRAEVSSIRRMTEDSVTYSGFKADVSCRGHKETEVMYYMGQVVTYTDEKPTMVEGSMVNTEELRLGKYVGSTRDCDYTEQRIKEKLCTWFYGNGGSLRGSMVLRTGYYGEGGSLRGSMVLRGSKVHRKNIVIL